MLLSKAETALSLFYWGEHEAAQINSVFQLHAIILCAPSSTFLNYLLKITSEIQFLKYIYGKEE